MPPPPPSYDETMNTMVASAPPLATEDMQMSSSSSEQSPDPTHNTTNSSSTSEGEWPSRIHSYSMSYSSDSDFDSPHGPIREALQRVEGQTSLNDEQVNESDQPVLCGHPADQEVEQSQEQSTVSQDGQKDEEFGFESRKVCIRVPPKPQSSSLDSFIPRTSEDRKVPNVVGRNTKNHSHHDNRTHRERNEHVGYRNTASRDDQTNSQIASLHNERDNRQKTNRYHYGVITGNERNFNEAETNEETHNKQHNKQHNRGASPSGRDGYRPTPQPRQINPTPRSRNPIPKPRKQVDNNVPCAEADGLHGITHPETIHDSRHRTLPNLSLSSESELPGEPRNNSIGESRVPRLYKRIPFSISNNPKHRPHRKILSDVSSSPIREAQSELAINRDYFPELSMNANSAHPHNHPGDRFSMPYQLEASHNLSESEGHSTNAKGHSTGDHIHRLLQSGAHSELDITGRSKGSNSVWASQPSLHRESGYVGSDIDGRYDLHLADGNARSQPSGRSDSDWKKRNRHYKVYENSGFEGDDD